MLTASLADGEGQVVSLEKEGGEGEEESVLKYLTWVVRSQRQQGPLK